MTFISTYFTVSPVQLFQVGIALGDNAKRHFPGRAANHSSSVRKKQLGGPTVLAVPGVRYCPFRKRSTPSGRDLFVILLTEPHYLRQIHTYAKPATRNQPLWFHDQPTSCACLRLRQFQIGPKIPAALQPKVLALLRIIIVFMLTAKKRRVVEVAVRHLVK